MSSPCASNREQAPVVTVCSSSGRAISPSLHQVEILAEVLSLKTRRLAAIVIGSKIFKALDLSGKETTAERTVRDEANAKLPARGQNSVFWIARPQRVHSDCSAVNGMDLGSTPRRVSGPGLFGQADVPDLPFLHQFRHRSDFGLFDRSITIHAMQVIKIDVINPQSL